MKYISMLLLSLGFAAGQAMAGDNIQAGVGGALGGVLGSVVGQHIGGSTGAAIGAGVGGAAGGSVAARNGHKTEEFLRELASNTELPQDIRSYAKSLLRHYWGFHAHFDTQSTNTWTAIPR